METLDLKGRKGLVVGIANEDSLAWWAARHIHNAGAELAITYFNDKAKPRVEPLARQRRQRDDARLLRRRMGRRHSKMETDMRTTLKYALLAAATTLSPLTAQAQTYERPGWGYGWDWGWGFGHMAFGGLMMLLFWGGVIVLIVLAVRWLGTGPSQGVGSPPPGKRALDILQERFARGEIDKQEYEERKRLLSD